MAVRRSHPTTATGGGDAPFVAGAKGLRERARCNTEESAVAEVHGADSRQVAALLDAAPATERICVPRSKSHAPMTLGGKSEAPGADIRSRAADDKGHAGALASLLAGRRGAQR